MEWNSKIRFERLFAFVGCLISLSLHLLSCFSPSMIGQMKYLWILHLVALILIVPAIQSLDIINKNSSYKHTFSNVQKYTPKWMLTIFYLLIAYTFINFSYTIFFLKKRQAATVIEGQYYLFKNNKEVVQEIDKTDYHRHQGYSMRNSSAYWLLFFYLDLLLFSACMKKEGALNQQASLLERYKGCFLGLAVGDALGTTLEFKKPGSFKPIKDIVGGGPFRLQAGQWTDDTSMALCLAESLINRNTFDLKDQLIRYCQWYEKGYLSSTGQCFDIGQTTRMALDEFKKTRNPYSGSTDPLTAGNGSIMRIAPVPLRYATNPREAIFKAGESSKTTHGAKEAVDACRYMAGIIVGTLQGVTKDRLLSPSYSPIPNLWKQAPLAPKIALIANGSFKKRNPPDIQGTGYVVSALEAALWAFYKTNSFKEGALLAVNLGNDADTTGAIYGQIAGAFYGLHNIPAAWIFKLSHKELIEDYAQKLYELATYDT